MIKELEGPKHFDLRRYAIGKLAQEIDQIFCKHFGVDEVFYYFESCRTHRTIVDYAPTRLKPDNKEVCACHHHRRIWCGPGILHFIHTAQKYIKKYNDAPTLFVTDCKTKGVIEHYYAEFDRTWKDEDRAYEAMRAHAIGRDYSIATYHKLHEEKNRLYKLCDEAEQNLKKHEYWIGDAGSNGSMICCDPMFNHLWNATKGVI